MTKRERLNNMIIAYNKLQKIDKDCKIAIDLKNSIDVYINNYNKK